MSFIEHKIKFFQSLAASAPQPAGQTVTRGNGLRPRQKSNFLKLQVVEHGR